MNVVEDVLAPDNAMPSAGRALNTKLHNIFIQSLFH